EELHASDLVHRQHGRGEPRRRAEEHSPRHAGLVGIGLGVLADPLAHRPAEEERGPLRLGGHRALGAALIVLEVLEDLAFHVFLPIPRPFGPSTRPDSMINATYSEKQAGSDRPSDQPAAPNSGARV